jgi:hypothetical protein
VSADVSGGGFFERDGRRAVAAFGAFGAAAFLAGAARRVRGLTVTGGRVMRLRFVVPSNSAVGSTVGIGSFST